MNRGKDVVTRLRGLGREVTWNKSMPGHLVALGALLLVVVRCAGFPAVQTVPPAAPVAFPSPDSTSRVRVNEVYGRLPMSFEANLGQKPSAVKYLSRGPGYTLFLTSEQAVLLLSKGPGNKEKDFTERPHAPSAGGETRGQAVLRMQLVGANPSSEVTGVEPLPGRASYFRGNDPAKWVTDISLYARVKYEGIYPGVDLVFYGSQRQLEYDLVVAPGADPGVIRFRLAGADRVEIDAQGDLVLHLGDGEVRLKRPFVYQEAGERKEAVCGQYVFDGKDGVSFRVAAYDASRPLVLDPVLVYSTYLGGMSADNGRGIAVDASGNVYVTGYTESPDFPLANALDSNWRDAGNSDAFVTKINASGTALVYSTYLGGVYNDRGWGIAVDASGNAYVTGETESPDFPLVNALDPTYGRYFDAFVTKINASGTALVYSTYLSGRYDDEGYSIAVDASGNAYVTGYTESPDFPLANALDSTWDGGNFDAFVTKINGSGTALVYSTYLGGSSNDLGYGIAIDASGNAYITGWTESSDFPLANAMDSTYGGGQDAFVTKINASGTALVYSTYLGGNYEDRGRDIAVDASGNAYVTGDTSSSDFPLANAMDPTYGGGQDAFVTKINPSGTALVYSTYLGGNDDDWGMGIAVDASGNAYVTGFTDSTDFPLANALDSTPDGHYFEAFVTKINASGTALVYSTYLGGNYEDRGRDIAVDASGNAYVTGDTNSPDFPLVNPIDSTLGVFEPDAFVVKISGGPSVGEILSDIKANAADGPVTVAPQDTLSITVALDNLGSTDNADWWVAANTPFGLYFYTFAGWRANLQPAYQGALFSFSSFELLNIPASVLPAGEYTFYFAVDTVMDGNITAEHLYFDFVQVNVVK